MRVFISFSDQDASLAKQLVAALRRDNIETWSSLDVPSGEDWKRLVDQESASADAYVFLLGAGASANPQLQAEWRWFLRNDWESKKPLIPIVHARDASLRDLPPFLRNRRPIFTTNFDSAIDEIRYLIEHPSETVDRTREQQSRVEFEKRMNDLRDYALALKEAGAGGEVKPQ